MALELFSFRYPILILVMSFSMLIQSGLSWHAPSADLSEFYSMPQCWEAMTKLMVCGFKISEILGGKIGGGSVSNNNNNIPNVIQQVGSGDGSMNLVAISDGCCKAINDVSSKCAFEGVNPLDLFIPPFVKDLCVGSNGDLFTPNYPFVDDPYGPLKNPKLKKNHVSPRRLHRTLPIRPDLFVPRYNLFP